MISTTPADPMAMATVSGFRRGAPVGAGPTSALPDGEGPDGEVPEGSGQGVSRRGGARARPLGSARSAGRRSPRQSPRQFAGKVPLDSPGAFARLPGPSARPLRSHQSRGFITQRRPDVRFGTVGIEVASGANGNKVSGCSWRVVLTCCANRGTRVLRPGRHGPWQTGTEAAPGRPCRSCWESSRR